MTKPKAKRPRIRRARPLLLAVGAAMLLAGCGDNSCANGICPDASGSIGDMGFPAAPIDMATGKDGGK